MNEEHIDGFREIYSEYSDEHILSLLKEEEVSFDSDAWKLLQEEAEKRLIKNTDDNKYIGPLRASLMERLLAFTIDYVILTIYSVGFIALMPTRFWDKPAELMIFMIFMIVGNLLFILKDSTGQSPGKKLMKIKIVNKDNLKKPNVFLPFFRNLFLFLGIIEIIAILISKDHERLGDRYTKTIVIKKRSYNNPVDLNEYRI